MEKSKITAIKSQFDDTIHIIDETDVEYWLARELMSLLGYERWENFEKAIARSMESCQTSGIAVSDHFREVTKLITAGKGAKRNVKDYMLTRYACYLIAQNGDPKKGDCLCTELFCRADQKAGTYRRTYCVYRAHRSPRQTVGIRKAAVAEYL